MGGRIHYTNNGFHYDMATFTLTSPSFAHLPLMLAPNTVDDFFLFTFVKITRTLPSLELGNRNISDKFTYRGKWCSPYFFFFFFWLCGPLIQQEDIIKAWVGRALGREWTSGMLSYPYLTSLICFHPGYGERQKRTSTGGLPFKSADSRWGSAGWWMHRRP